MKRWLNLNLEISEFDIKSNKDKLIFGLEGSISFAFIKQLKASDSLRSKDKVKPKL